MNNKKIEIRNLKGTYDFAPDKQQVRNQIVDVLKSNFAKYGYLPLETPILNEFDLLKYKYEDGAEILSEIYKLTDQGKRDLGLRYDLTIPFCKFIALNKDLTMPFRRYEIGKVFRDGPVKAGRAREFSQCDVDVVGVDGRFVEVEQMQLVANVFNQLGIDIEIRWNNRKLMVGLLEEFGLEEHKVDEAVSLLDRIEKISRKELVEEFEKIGINEQKVDEILTEFSKDLQGYASKYQNTENEILKLGIEECLEVQKIVDAVGLTQICKFTPKLARGLSIYTGTVFEFFDKEKRITSSLGGGGRYNKIITGFMDNGIEYPAVGLSFGMEPIYYILSQNKIESMVDVLVVPMNTEIECMQLAESLRKVGARVVVELSGRRVKKAFDYANKLGIKYVMVVGEDELSSGLYSIKDMEKGEQENLKLEEILQKLSKKA